MSLKEDSSEVDTRLTVRNEESSRLPKMMMEAINLQFLVKRPRTNNPFEKPNVG